jgi:hypothetical protein
MSTPSQPPSPRQRQDQITAKIDAAKQLLSEACQLACPLAGWADQWEDIGKSYDHLDALWGRIHQAPEPGEPVKP